MALPIRAGEAAGIIGRNGPGKTTLVRPPQGGVAACGLAMNDAPPDRFARQGIANVPAGRCTEGMV